MKEFDVLDTNGLEGLMMRNEIEKLAKRAMSLTPGVNNKHLKLLDGSWAPYLRFLYLVVKTFQPKVALDLGTSGGLSAAHMAAGWKDTQVVTVDNVFRPEAEELCRNFDNIVTITNNSTSQSVFLYMQNLHKYVGSIGLIFHDTVHDGLHEMAEYNLYNELFAPETLVAVDDLLGPAHQKEAMGHFFSWLPGEKIELHGLHPQRIAPGVDYHDAPGFGVSIVLQKSL